MTDELDWFGGRRPDVEPMTDAQFEAGRERLFGSRSEVVQPSPDNTISVAARPPETVSRRGRLVSAAAALIIVVGLVAVVAARRSTDEGPAPAARPATEAPRRPGLIFSAATGTEPRVFSGTATSSDSTPDIAISSADDEQVCTIVASVGPEETCVSIDDVRTGIIHAVFGTADGGYLIVGIVPDDVEAVLVSGADVDHAGNVWSVRVGDDSPRSLTVRGTTTGVSAGLPPALPETPPTTQP